jgi:hypothetical protein
MRKTRIIAIVIGALLVVLGRTWRPLIAPRLERFPTDVDETLRYEGTITLSVDEATGAALTTPITQPVTIVRRLVSAGDQSYERARLTETITMTIPGGRTQVERHRYVLDRGSMQFVADPENWSYFPDNRVDRSGMYRLNLPTDLGPTSFYKIWNNETGAFYRVVGTGKKAELDGLEVVRFEGQLAGKPVSPAFVRQQKLPTTVGAELLAPQLEKFGLDLAAVQTLLTTALTPDDASAFAAALAKPIPLKYEFYFSGAIAAEPETGAIVALEGVTEGVRVRPDLAAFTALKPRLQAYGSDPVVGAIGGLLNTLGAQPAQPVYELKHAQTAASVAQMVDTARDSRAQKRLVEDVAPWVVLGLGSLLYLGGLIWAVRARRRDDGEPTRPSTVRTTVEGPARTPAGVR